MYTGAAEWNLNQEDDTTEYKVTGVILALMELSQVPSCVYVFTYTGPKRVVVLEDSR